MDFEIVKQFVYRVEKNDTIASLCLKFNTSVDNIFRNNKNIELYEGELIEIKVNNYITHIVKPMQTLAYISEKYNVSYEELKVTNNLESDKLYIGQTIKIYNKKTL